MKNPNDPADAWRASWSTEVPEAIHDSLDLAKRIMFLATMLGGVMRRELAALHLTTAEYDVIVALRRVPAPHRMKPGQLAQSLMLSSGGTTNVTHRLLERGLVARGRDDCDGRSTWITLTVAGFSLAERALVANARAQDEFFAPVPAGAREAAADALREVFSACQHFPHFPQLAGPNLGEVTLPLEP